VAAPGPSGRQLPAPAASLRRYRYIDQHGLEEQAGFGACLRFVGLGIHAASSRNRLSASFILMRRNNLRLRRENSGRGGAPVSAAVFAAKKSSIAR
jgi:hypothetical protein